MYEKWADVLEKCRLFRGITKDELNTMLDCMKPKVQCYGKNSLIVTEGDEIPGLGILLSGEAIVVMESAAGSRTVMSLLKPGDMFGEMAVFSGKGTWPASVFSQGPCCAVFLPSAGILGECNKLCTSHRLLIVNMLEVISQKALMLNRKVEYLATRSLRGKIARFLLEQGGKAERSSFRMPLKRNELADFLNVSRPSLSREMCRMRDEGIITFNRSSIQIKDYHLLKESLES